jgi:hypothetical protein
MKVHITARVDSFLSGTSVYQSVVFKVTDEEMLADRESPEAISLMRKIVGTKSTRKDWRITVDLTEAEIRYLAETVECMYLIGKDNAWDADGRADLNAAAALLRQLEKVTA